MSSIQERVQRGAQWLDEVRPGWRDEINLKIFDISDCEVCVLGQVFATQAEAANDGIEDGFDYGCWLATGSRSGQDWFVAHGFDDDPRAGIEYAPLGAEWRRVIHASRVPAEVIAVEAPA